MSTKPVEVVTEQSGEASSHGTVTDLIFEKFDAVIRNMRGGLKARLRLLAPRQLKKHRILAGPLHGYWIVTSWQHYHTGIIGRTEPRLIAWFQETVKPGETWLDVGANYGYTALAMRRLAGQEGRVFAFEPKLSTCGCLSQTMLLNGLPEVTVLPMGLGSPESLELKRLVTIGGMVASGPEIVDEFRPRVREIAKAESLETIAVARLDWLWPQICGTRPRIDGVKIDVQGMELEVLRGMRGLLNTYHPKLVVEFHSGVDRVALLDLLESCGYLRRGKPIYDMPGEKQEPQYYDNWSYTFTVR